MRDHATWSIGIGRWGGVPFRLHALFLLFAACTLYAAQSAALATSSAANVAAETHAAVWLATASLFVLYVSVLLHEVGHLFAAKQFGGGADQIVLGPLGGLAPVRCPREPRTEMLVHVAGPLVNLAIAWGICFPLLVLRGDGSRVLGLLDPLSPNLVDPSATPWQSLAPLAFWINWCLVVVNCIPAYPFDGGQILRAVLTNWRPELGREVASLGVARLAKAGGIALLVMAWLVREEPVTGPVPSWFALLMLAGCVYFSGRQQEQAVVAENSYWAPAEAWPPVGRLPPPSRRQRAGGEDEAEVATWGDGIREIEDELVEEHDLAEPDDDRRLDEVLARLHEVGLANLTEDERRVLERASARYRGRNSRTSS